jgi:hypothetical protein
LTVWLIIVNNFLPYYSIKVSFPYVYYRALKFLGVLK